VLDPSRVAAQVASGISVRLELHGTGLAADLAAELGALDGVLAVNVERPDDAE
jgi:hypothetical protein